MWEGNNMGAPSCRAAAAQAAVKSFQMCVQGGGYRVKLVGNLYFIGSRMAVCHCASWVEFNQRKQRRQIHDAQGRNAHQRWLPGGRRRK